MLMVTQIFGAIDENRNRLQIKPYIFITLSLILSLSTFLFFIQKTDLAIAVPFICFMWISFLYVAFARERDLLVMYARESFVLVARWLIVTPALYFIETSRFPPPETILDAKYTIMTWYIILGNLFISLFIVFVREIVKKSIESIIQRNWKKTVVFNGLLWLYPTWAFAFLYSIFDCLYPSSCCGVDQITTLDFYHFSLSALTTLGFGNITPSGVCKVLAGIEALVGFLLVSIIAGIVVFIITQQVQRERRMLQDN